MPIYNKMEIGRVAQQYGFVRDTFEKVLRLKEILKYMNEEEYLKEHLLLKGGTAINLTIFNLPRLSVDIDMDYTPNDIKKDMLEAREKITKLIKDYMQAEGYHLSSGSRFTYSLTSPAKKNKIKFTSKGGSAWSSISVNGTANWQGTLQNGASHTVTLPEGTTSFNISLGNSNVTNITINGKKFDFLKENSTLTVRQITVNVANE